MHSRSAGWSRLKRSLFCHTLKREKKMITLILIEPSSTRYLALLALGRVSDFTPQSVNKIMRANFKPMFQIVWVKQTRIFKARLSGKRGWERERKLQYFDCRPRDFPRRDEVQLQPLDSAPKVRIPPLRLPHVQAGLPVTKLFCVIIINAGAK
jgi:hypothetical protein